MGGADVGGCDTGAGESVARMQRWRGGENNIVGARPYRYKYAVPTRGHTDTDTCIVHTPLHTSGADECRCWRLKMTRVDMIVTMCATSACCRTNV